MFLGILVLLTALTISAVAIYYSVAGLVAIFAAAAVPIMIMGGALEIAKLVTAVWLHRYWHQATWWLKSYLTVAVIVLMFITSMGIFGFLSKAHIDQTAAAGEGLAQIERIDTEIQRLEAAIDRTENEILSLENSGTSQDNTIQEQIDREQYRIDSAYERIQPAIDEQNRIVERVESENTRRISEIQTQINSINQRVTALDSALAENNVRLAQSIVGVRQDGSLGPGTERAIQDFRTEQRQQVDQLTARVEEITNNPSAAVVAARAEIQRLRSIAEAEIADSNALISRLRSQIGTVDTASVNAEIEIKETFISQSLQTISGLEEQRFNLESEYRKLEAEVGPIKYLAEFVYGESADKDLLEEAVRWVIIIIIFVFDPLAVLLLVASQYTFEIQKKERSKKLLEEKNELSDRIDEQGSSPSSDDQEPGLADSRPIIEEPEADSSVPGTGHEERDSELERSRELEELENSEEYKSAKQRWKEENPDKTIKEFKEAYIQGRIKELPWEGYVQNAEQGTNSIWQRIRNRNE